MRPGDTELTLRETEPQKEFSHGAEELRPSYRNIDTPAAENSSSPLLSSTVFSSGPPVFPRPATPRGEAQSPPSDWRPPPRSRALALTKKRASLSTLINPSRSTERGELKLVRTYIHTHTDTINTCMCTNVLYVQSNGRESWRYKGVEDANMPRNCLRFCFSVLPSGLHIFAAAKGSVRYSLLMLLNRRGSPWTP